MSTSTHVILVTGHAGAGKTTLARSIAQKTKGVLLDKDSMFSHFVHKMLLEAGEHPHTRDSAYYTDVIREREYASLCKTISDNIGVAQWVIAAAPWTHVSVDELQNIGSMLIAKGATVHIVWVGAEEDVQKENLTSRGYFRDRNKLANWEEYRDGLEDNPAASLLADYIIDNKEHSPEALERLRNNCADGVIAGVMLDH